MKNDVINKITHTYQQRTPGSLAHHARAEQYLPGGDTRWSTFYAPYPTYMIQGEGCTLQDADGNRYIDYVNNYTSLVHGHAHPAVVAAATRATQASPIFGAPSPDQYQLAGLICKRMPAVDLLRYANSGTEATMMAMRAARAFTGKQLILKVDGGYHGSHDFAEVNISPSPNPEGLPDAHVEGRGVPQVVLDGILVARFNDLATTEELLEQHRGQVAAIIVEPVPNTAGIIPAQPGYLKGLRSLADRYGALLIFDEIVTFRLSTGGSQLLESVSPDLTALGKIIGGGFAIGAFGGRREIMERFHPAHPQFIKHSGTFNGHNVTMAAGLAALQHFNQPEIDHINHLGQRLKTGIDAAFEGQGIQGHASHAGSLLYVQWTHKPIRTPLDVVTWKKSAAELPRLLHLALLNRGVFAANRGLMNISTPMTEAIIDQTVSALEDALQELKPYIHEVTPHLLLQ